MKRILVVDDSMSALLSMQRCLTRIGYETILAENGVCAIEMIKEKSPDIILMDVLMPHMHGLECLQIIKADPDVRHIPVIMITSMSDSQIEIISLRAGASDFLKKPVNVEILKLRIEKILEPR